MAPLQICATVEGRPRLLLQWSEQKDWEEFSQKLRSQLAAGSVKTVELMDVAALEMTEQSVEEADWILMSDEQFDEDKVQGVSAKLFNVLMSVTMGEASAVAIAAGGGRCRKDGCSRLGQARPCEASRPTPESILCIY